MELFKRSVYQADPIDFFFKHSRSLCFPVVIVAAAFIFNGLLHGCCDKSGTRIFCFIRHIYGNRRISGTLNKTPPSGRRGLVFRAPR